MVFRRALLSGGLARFIRLYVLCAGFFLLSFWAQASERVEVTLQVADGRCTAVLYGRSSTIDCPALAGGASIRAVRLPFDLLNTADENPLRLRPTWRDVRITDAHGQPLAADTIQPATFNVDAVLFSPNAPAGLVLSQPASVGVNAGTVAAWPAWVFVIDAANRRGEWWQWAGAPWELRGGPSVPLRGIPIDRPLSEQIKPLISYLLTGGALAALWASLLLMRQLESPDEHGQPRAASERGSRGPYARWGWLFRQLTSIVSGRQARYGALIPCLVAFAVALHIAVDVLEGVPHVQDSVTYLFQAETMARGALTAPAPPLAAAESTAHFDQEFLLVRDDRWFGKYPPGWPALLAAGVRLGAPWLVNPLLAALSIALIFRLGVTLGARGSRGAGEQGGVRHASRVTPNSLPASLPTALLTAVLLATSPFFLIMSGSLMAHPAELFWALLFMLAWAKALARPLVTHHAPAARWAVVAGLALGALFLTRQFTAVTIGLAYGATLGAAHFLKCVAPFRPAAIQGPEERATPFRKCIARIGLALLTALPLLLALPLYQAAVTGDARTDPRLLYWPYDRVGFGPGVGEPQNAFTMTPTDARPAITWYTDPTQPPRGHTPARGLYNLGRNLEALENDLFGWPPLTTLVFVWLAFLLRRPSALDWLLLLVILAVAGGYVAYWASGIAYGPRYFYAALPALIILTARGITAFLSIGGRFRLLTIIIPLVLLGYNLYHLPGRITGYQGYNFVSAAGLRTVEGVAQSPALVFVKAEADWWEYGAFFSGNTPWLDGPIVYARDLDPTANARLRAHFPDRRAYYWSDGKLEEE